MTPGPGAQFIEKTVSRLKFPQAFAVFVGLFLFDLIIPDFVPFVDEILLGLGAALFGMWRERVSTTRPAPDAPPAPKPATKNITPGD
ncbi:MAG: DUF6116 family protein [Thermoanaerobaculia bacterium]